MEFQIEDEKAPTGQGQGFSGNVENDCGETSTAAGPAGQGPRATIVTSKMGALSKSFSLSSDGELIKKPGGKLVYGELYSTSIQSARELADLLEKQTSHNALIYGVCDYNRAFIATEGYIEELRRGTKAHENVTVKGDKVYGKDDIPFVARVRNSFHYPDGPAVMMLDYDVPRVEGVERLDTDALLEILDTVSGGALSKAPFVVAHSTSSFIYNGETQIKGASGVRILALVENGSDIKRAGNALYERLILAGNGYAEISKSGNISVKTLVDQFVWQPERFDFVSGAHCEPPLEQRRPPFEVHNSDADYLDTASAFPELSSKERKEFAAIKEDIKKSVADEARKVRIGWAEVRAKEKCEASGIDPDDDPVEYDKTRRMFLRAVDRKVLMGDFELIAQNGDVVTVGTIMDDPATWNGKKFHDPLEPDYNNSDPRICTAYLYTKGPKYLHSFAHGGRKFILNRHLRTITVKAGERAEIVRTALEILKTDGGIYVRGKELVRVGDNGELWPLDLSGLQYELDVFARWEKYSAREKRMVPTDAPEAIAKGVLAARNEWPFQEVRAVVRAPIFLPETGRVIEAEGLDDESGIFVSLAHGGVWPGVPQHPTKSDAAAAVADLWRPFAEFPMIAPVDRGVALAAILTAFTRPALDKAPAFGFTAPVAGSGKSLLALALSRLAGAASADVMPGKVGDEEIRKRLLAIGRRASAVCIFDNVSGAFASDSLCAWLTSENFKDRVLGVSQDTTVPTKTLMLLTGNNLTLKGDLCRRVLLCRIDPKTENPHKRSFSMDPLAYCRDNYLSLAAAAITLIMYYNDKPCLAPDRTASFETWSDTIRKTVMYVGEDGLLEDIADPVDAIAEAYNSDPETMRLRTFLQGWYATFGDKPTSIAECISRATSGVSAEDEEEDAAALPGVIDEIAAQRGRVEPRILAAWMRASAGRILNGFTLEKHKIVHGAMQWRVRNLPKAA